MSLSPRWTFLALLLFLNTVRSYGFENVTIEERMLRASLVERADAHHGKETRQISDHYRHIAAIGDVHGNLDNLKQALFMAGVTNQAGEWGKSTAWEDKPPEFLVQVGDLMDKGNQVDEVFAFFDELRTKAPGKIFTLFGNHEWMNLLGDWVSIHRDEKDERGSAQTTRYNKLFTGKIGISLREHFITALRLPLHPWAGEPNEPYVMKNPEPPLSRAAVAFVHAGFSRMCYRLLERFPEKINEASASLLEKVQNCKPMYAVFDKDSYDRPFLPPPKVKLDDDERLLLDPSVGPFWYRGWATKPDEVVCKEVEEVRRLTGTAVVIVGHSFNIRNDKTSEIHTKCHNKLIFIDTGMNTGNLAVLSIEHGVIFEENQWKAKLLIRAIARRRGAPASERPTDKEISLDVETILV